MTSPSNNLTKAAMITTEASDKLTTSAMVTTEESDKPTATLVMITSKVQGDKLTSPADITIGSSEKFVTVGITIPSKPRQLTTSVDYQSAHHEYALYADTKYDNIDSSSSCTGVYHHLIVIAAQQILKYLFKSLLNLVLIITAETLLTVTMAMQVIVV